MHSLEKDMAGDKLGAHTLLLFQLAFEKNHPDAAWIYPVMDLCKGNVPRIVSHFGKMDDARAQYFVWLHTRDEAPLLCAAVTGWPVAYSTLLLNGNLSKARCDWILGNGTRNAQAEVFDIQQRCFSAFTMEKWSEHEKKFFMTHPRMTILVVDLEPLESVTWIDLCMSMRFESAVPKDTYSKFAHMNAGSNEALYEFALGLVSAGYALEFIATTLSKRAPNVVEIMTSALDLHKITSSLGASAVSTLMVILRRNGFPRDMLRLIYNMCCRISPTHWLCCIAPRNKNIKK